MRLPTDPNAKRVSLAPLVFALTVNTGAWAQGLAPSDLPTTPVTTAPLAEKLFAPVRTAPATVVTLNNARVSAENAGLLQEIRFKVGEKVDRDAVIAKIDCRDAEAELASAEAAAAASKAKNSYDQSRLASARKLSANKNISGDEIDKRRADAQMSSAAVDKAQAELEKSRLAVSRCELKAPFNAVVVDRLASVGDFVSRGSPVLQLLDIESVEVSARIQDIDIESVENGQGHEFVTQNESYPVRLRTIVPLIESRLRSYEARFSFARDGPSPGSAGRLTWASPVPHLPAELLVRRDGLGVFMMRDGLAEFVALPDAQEGKPAPVSEPLGGQVIVDGRFNVNDGDPVTIIAP